jgi:hypothetical protein
MDDIRREPPRDSPQKAAVNQSLFREVNERVEEINTGRGRVAPLSVFVCECADPECTQRLTLTVAEYEQVRANGSRFVVAPDHANPNFERVVQDNKRFAVVEKTATAAELAEQLDPRAAAAERPPDYVPLPVE